MDRAGIVSTIVAASLLGVLIGIVPNDQQRLSVDLWLVAVAAWAGLGLARRALGVVPGERDRLRLPLRFHRQPEPEEPAAPRSLLALEGSFLAAGDNARSYDYRLRPRLRQVTGHRLRVNRGIDLDREPERARLALGDVAWLIDEDDDGAAGEGPAPSPAELTRLLDRSEPHDDGSDR